MQTEILIIILVALLVLAAHIGLFLWIRGQRARESGRTEQMMAALFQNMQLESRELSGRLAALNEAQTRSQAELQKAMNERLDAVTLRVGQSLHETAEKAAQSFGEIQTRLSVIDAAQKNLETLSNDIVGLQDILSNKQRRGAFGEVQLADLVANILPPNAYGFQVTLSSGVRADCVLKLPNPPGDIVVDAKFPLEAYQALMAATDDAQKKEARRLFTSALTKHVNDIAAKYIIPGETAESALMFLPSEAVYATLHAEFEDVVQKSFQSRVWIVSPTTLWATLNTVRAVLRDVQMREQAHLIQKEVRVLLQDVNRLDDRVGKLQTHFNQTADDIRQIQISSGKITSRAEKIDALELEDGKSVAVTPHTGQIGG